ncbi:MFS transporter [Teredinibacter purpureus]|uniref:MFS transporter n=1 Tax=Teredinibacter purpureus TaxID=2731756 RepID=UPI0005F864F0|nr:MFS transporter [Teredinibacter purpureus]
MPYWRLSAVYFCYFAVVGALSPYWGLYLDDLGYKPAEIGLLSAIPMLTKLAAPNIWGALADICGRRLFIIRLGAAGACICFAGIFFSQNYFWLIVVIFAYSFFWNAILAQFEVVTLNYLTDEPHRYSRIRVWGSIGFIVTVVVLGYVLGYVSVRYLPLVIFFFLTGIFLGAVSLPNERDAHTQQCMGDFIRIVKQPVVIWFMLAMTLLQVSHGVYYTFYSLYLEDFHYSRSFIGILWAIGVIAEIVVFLKIPQLFRQFSIAKLLQFSLLVTAIRWAVIGLYPNAVLLITGIQLLHAFSFGVTHAIAIEFVRVHFGLGSQSQGQAFYSAVCFGAGNAIGAYASGLMWEVEPLWAFGFAVLSAFIAYLIALFYLPEKSFVL